MLLLFSMLHSLLDLFFPPRCEVCRKGGEAALCVACFSQIKFMKPQWGIYSASVYEGALRRALRRFKFNKRKNLAEPLGTLLVKYISQISQLKMREIDFILPVPLHFKRYRQRGFNQVELLAKVVSRYLEVPVIGALERVRNTHPQFDLPRERRLLNVREAFKVSDCALVANRRLLLLDDIYTTGATIAECCKTLKNAGAASIEVLTLARAVDGN
jgi:ComF family protein